MMGEGTVNDEELVEVIAEAIVAGVGAGGVLAALRSAGFQVFRPEDCERFSLGHCCEKHRRHYLLIPADSGGSG